MNSAGETISGGCPAGQAQGAGGEALFCIGASCSGVTLPGSETITVHIHTETWANEITWSIDDGELFGTDPQFADSTDSWEVMTLPAGFHTINYLDS